LRFASGASLVQYNIRIGASPCTGEANSGFILLVQLGVVPFGGGIKFLEPVIDAQYNGQSR